MSTKIYYKRDDFDFEIVNFPFLDGVVPRSTPYGVFISKLIRFARAFNLSSWCLVMVEWLFLAVPLGCLQFVIVVLADHTHLLSYLLMRLKGSGALAAVRSIRVYLLNFVCSGIQFFVLLSPYLCFISFYILIYMF